jgi:uncharacterized protein YkwD
MKKLLIILLLPISLYSQTRQSTIDSCRAIMFKLVNDHRIANGIHPLVHNDKAQKMAQDWAEHMYKVGKQYHSNYKVAENIGGGGPASDLDLFFVLYDGVYRKFNGFLKSPGHNENMLWKSYKSVGYGFYKGYCVQIFFN